LPQARIEKPGAGTYDGPVKEKILSGGKPVTAVVLAGGRGRRMKADKAGLDVGGRTLLEHVLAQVEPLFDEVLVCLSPGQSPPFGRKRAGKSGGPPSAKGAAAEFRFRVIEDDVAGLGPLAGILAGLKAARNDAGMIIACDIPDIDADLLEAVAGASGDPEIAVPSGPSGLYEPLFALYRKSLIPRIEALLASGERSILPLFDRCRVAVVPFDDPDRIRNLNTRADYEGYLRSRGGRKPGRSTARKRASPR
jgi:molybdopterin-guanine dinucleotide biosynthesis protein A